MTEWTTVPKPPESPNWATLPGQFVEIHCGSEIYRGGFVDEAMPDGSGLWMASDGILSRELIWREDGFTVGKVLPRPVISRQPPPGAGSRYPLGSQQERRTRGYSRD